ncbi:hypothetical protein BO70DRAFT_157913 [Aspergillus heteromorphus CBS 117.55]|uniref:Uncharacterized protein n=1 Tax=Aspergillus heteromorphus CBS 117.55 TaxID=1448321 RepID=A0A317WRA9_9EURO|nr:uncharacterized protein BO70DRAFT_157913 [Aspergillus heteromorphus CBS 117.55]PWY88976.1 hypothetical protein BO70DRAFT_157913 [Aspergillus heteromorphus CBS 117.55]
MSVRFLHVQPPDFWSPKVGSTRTLLAAAQQQQQQPASQQPAWEDLVLDPLSEPCSGPTPSAPQLSWPGWNHGKKKQDLGGDLSAFLVMKHCSNCSESRFSGRPFIQARLII